MRVLTGVVSVVEAKQQLAQVVGKARFLFVAQIK